MQLPFHIRPRVEKLTSLPYWMFYFEIESRRFAILWWRSIVLDRLKVQLKQVTGVQVCLSNYLDVLIKQLNFQLK